MSHFVKKKKKKEKGFFDQTSYSTKRYIRRSGFRRNAVHRDTTLDIQANMSTRQQIEKENIDKHRQGHLCLWREDSLEEEYNTKYYKIYFYVIFRACK